MPYRSASYLFTVIIALSACSTESTKGAAQGAVGGAAIGAVGGIVSALVFGGDVGDAAARGAVWGGSTGAVAGGVQGARVAEKKQASEARTQQMELNKLRSDIGDDAFRGMEALVDCKHTVAIAYAEAAQVDSNYDHALAGHWLEILAAAEQGNMGNVRPMLPTLVEKDRKLQSTEQASILVGEVLNELEEVREVNGQRRTCH